MEEERVSYEALQDLLRTERRGHKLTSLPPRFWSEVRTFLAEVTEEFRREQAKDPFSRKVMLLTDEVKNARNAARSLWALRERKLAMLALAQTHERQKPQGITPDEGELYDRLLETLDASRGDVLEDAAPKRPAAPAAPAPPSAPTVASPSASPDAPPAVTAPHAGPPAAPPVARQAEHPSDGKPVGAAPAPDAPAPPERPAPDHPAVPADAPGDDMVTIRALGDIPPFVGPDMQTYLLKEGDIATVPPAIARLLEKRKKAAIVEA